MKILYAEDDEDLRELFVLKLESILSAEITECESGNEAIEKLKESSEFKIIISDMNMPNGSGADLYSYIRKIGLQTPFIIFSGCDIENYSAFKTFKEDNSANAFIDKPPEGGTLEKAIDVAIEYCNKYSTPSDNIYEGDDVSHIHSFSAVSVKIFLKLNTSPVDVFIRLSDHKFIKIINKHEMYETDLIHKYIEKDMHKMFVETEFHKDFVDYCMDSLLTVLSNLDLEKSEDAVDTLVSAHKAVREQLLHIGLDEKVMELTKVTVDTTIKVMEKTPKLSKLLKSVKGSGDYIYEHSLMVSYLACGIVDGIDWVSKDTKIKLSLASFMHDITLKEHKLARVESLNSPEASDLKTEDIEKIKKHPVDAMNYVKKLMDYLQTLIQSFFNIMNFLMAVVFQEIYKLKI